MKIKYYTEKYKLKLMAFTKIKSACAIIMYHYVRDLRNSRFPGIKGLDIELFKRQLDFLQANFNIIRMEQLIAAVTEGVPLPPGAALLTFDDGYCDHYANVFPQLALRGLTGSFFIPVAVITKNRLLNVNKIHYIIACADENAVMDEVAVLLDECRKDGRISESDGELKKRLTVASRFDTPEIVFIKSLLQHGLKDELRFEITDKLFKKFVEADESVLARELYVNRDQVTHMKRCGMHIGLHGNEHFWLGKAEDADMKNDIRTALEFWSDIIDKNCWVMNYPYGSFNPDVIRFIREIGCRIGLTTRVAVADLSAGDALELPRLDTNDFPPISDNYLKYCGYK